MVFRLCAAQAGLPALPAIVSLHVIHPHRSEKRRWWSHTSVIPASKEWFSLDCMLTEYNVF